MTSNRKSTGSGLECNCSEQQCMLKNKVHAAFHKPINIMKIAKGCILLVSPKLGSNLSVSAGNQFPEDPSGQFP